MFQQQCNTVMPNPFVQFVPDAWNYKKRMKVDDSP